jgi:hypothetical protein
VRRPGRATYSVRYLPSLQGRTPMEQAYFFIRDVPLAIMPIRGQKDRPDFGVSIDPADDEVAAWLAGFIHIGQFEHQRLDEAVVEFVETAARYLAYSGEIYFEMVFADDAERPSRLVALPPGPVVRLPTKYLQVVPKADRSALEGHRYFAIPSRQMWRLRLPPEMGSTRQHRRMLSKLERLSGVMPPFAVHSGDLGHSAKFDFAAHHRACELGVERATNRWGTIPSLAQIEGTTEYFFLARRLAWQRSQAILREHILTELNVLLVRLRVPHRVIVAGLPTAPEILDALRKLHAGEIDIAAAMAVGRI